MFRNDWPVFERRERGLRIQKHRVPRDIQAYYVWIPYSKIIWKAKALCDSHLLTKIWVRVWFSRLPIISDTLKIATQEKGINEEAKKQMNLKNSIWEKTFVWTSDHGIIEKQRLEVSKFLGNYIVNEKMSLDLKVFDSEGLEAILESPNLFKQEVGFKSHAVLEEDEPPNIP